MEVETDKATVEIEAPASGILTNVTASAGDEIPVGNKIAVILAPGEVATPAAVLPGPSPSPALSQRRGETQLAPKLNQTSHVNPVATKSPYFPLAKGDQRGFSHPKLHLLASPRILASPAAKRIAKEKGIDLASLKGSGPDGAVLAEDVLRSGPAKLPLRGPPKIKETSPAHSHAAHRRRAR